MMRSASQGGDRKGNVPMTKNLTVGSPMGLILGFALPTLLGLLF